MFICEYDRVSLYNDYASMLNLNIACIYLHVDLYEGAASAAPATRNEPEGAPSAAPATQNEPEVLRVCTCHAKRGSAQSDQSSPDFRGPLWRCSNQAGAAPATQNEPEVLQVLRLPRKTWQRPK